MPQLIDLGRIRFAFLGDYSSATTYKVNDVVRYGAHLYVYINATNSAANTPTNTTYWSNILQGFKHRGAYSSGTTYLIGETVTYSGSIYQVNVSSTVGNVPTNASYWNLIVEGVFPEQTGLNNYVLKTNGSTTSWTNAPELNELTVNTESQFKGDIVQTFRQVTVTNTSLASNVATITTNEAHLFDVGDVVVIAGASNMYDGAATIATVPSATTFTIPKSGSNIASAADTGTATVYSNLISSGNLTTSGNVTLSSGALNVTSGTSSFGGNVTLSEELTTVKDAEFKQEVEVEGAFSVVGRTRVISHRALSGTTVTFTTTTPHGLLAGETFTTSTFSDNAYNFTGQVLAVPTTTTFTATKAIGGGNVSQTQSAGSVFAKSLASFININVNEDATIEGGLIVEDISQQHGISYVGSNAKPTADDIGTNVKSISNKALTSNVATLTTSTAHGFSAFQSVVVAGVGSPFDGEYEISETPTSTTFTYAKTNANISSVASSGGTASAVTGFTNLIAYFTTDAEDYSQVVVQNTADSAASSSDFIAYPDNGTDFAGYIDMGITSSVFSDPEFTITGPNDGYIFMTAPVGSTGAGNLVLATGDTGSENKIVFAAGGLSSNNEQMSITPDQNVHIEIPTPSTSATTGAFTVVGGVGIQGDLNIQGDVAIEGTITFGGGGTTVETANLAVTDPIVFVGTDNADDIVDLSFVGEYQEALGSTITKTTTNKALTNNVATITTSTSHGLAIGHKVVITDLGAPFDGTHLVDSVPTATTFTFNKTNANVASVADVDGSVVSTSRSVYTGLSRDASDGVYKLFNSGIPKPTSTVDFSAADYAPLRIGALTATDIAASGTLGVSGTSTLGVVNVSGAAGFTSPVTVSSTLTVTGRLDVQEIREDVIDSTIASNILACDYALGNVFFQATAPTANFTAAVTNMPTDNGKTMSISIVVTQGATGYIPSAMTIAGVSTTIKWGSGVTPTPTSGVGKIDIFSFTFIRRGDAWTVLGSAVGNF